MVVGAFPAIKLGILAFKQLSKPIANVMKERAKSHPFFRKYICMPPAQCKRILIYKIIIMILKLHFSYIYFSLRDSLQLDGSKN